MTNEEIRIAVAEECGVANRWVLMKRGMYYRPKANGYTDRIQEAWIMSEEGADRHTYPHDEPVTKHRAPLPNYPEDLNACAEMEKFLTTEKEQDEYCEYLGKVFHIDMILYPKDSWRFLRATALQRCEAFLRVKGGWKS